MRLTKAQLPIAMVALYNASRVQGNGILHPDAGQPLTIEEAQQLIEHYAPRSCYIDYLRGRCIKVSFHTNKDMDFRLFDRDYGEGAGERAVRAALGK